MNQLLGERLIEKNHITEQQLNEALNRQRLHGGRLGDNLVALGFVSEDAVSSFFSKTPPPLRKLEDTGLSTTFITDMVMKHALQLTEFSIPEIAGRIKLPHTLVDKAIDELRKEHLLEVRSAGQISTLTYRFVLTEAGRNHAQELLDYSHYVGPAPVTYADYRSMVQTQTIKSILVEENTVQETFSNIIVKDSILERLGPAVSSGKAIFLYGPPGNGKTTIAETIGRILPDVIYVPYALYVGGEIITVFDHVTHIPVEPDLLPDMVDQRWVLVKRPVVMVGGEMTLKNLDLEFNPVTKFYEAPLQMKANNGLFIIDDFGRQQVDPQKLLNRWIVPLERRTDFLTLHTGMKFEIPFDQLVVFSTNLEPKHLVDEAFLRRIRYKIKIDHPSVDEYRRIFERVCRSNGITFNPEAFNYLVEHHYQGQGVAINACHARDLIDSIIDEAHYHRQPPSLTPENIATAWDYYFVEL